MKKEWWRYIILAIVTVATVVLLVVNALIPLKGFWKIGISGGIEIFILIYVSYYLVQYQNKIEHKKEKIGKLISKIQSKIMQPDLIDVSTDDNKKITRIKLGTISNLLEIVKNNVENPKNIEVIISYMDNLNSIVMDHIDDSEYIEKSHPQIIKAVTDIDTQLERIRFDEDL